MTHWFFTREAAEAALRRTQETKAMYPPMWPITDIKVEARTGGHWVVVGDYSAWP